jgi:hypothetical protein
VRLRILSEYSLPPELVWLRWVSTRSGHSGAVRRRPDRSSECVSACYSYGVVCSRGLRSGCYLPTAVARSPLYLGRQPCLALASLQCTACSNARLVQLCQQCCTSSGNHRWTMIAVTSLRCCAVTASSVVGCAVLQVERVHRIWHVMSQIG